MNEERPVTGRWFEELPVGFSIKHAITRTITETDNILFTSLTMNPQPLHLDETFAAQTEFGQRLVNSLLTLSLLVGVTVYDLTLGTTIANLGFESIEFPEPVFHGDTIRAESAVIASRPSQKRPDAGIVTFEHRAYNQRGELVAHCRRAALMRRKPTSVESEKEETNVK